MWTLNPAVSEKASPCRQLQGLRPHSSCQRTQLKRMEKTKTSRPRRGREIRNRAYGFRFSLILWGHVSFYYAAVSWTPCLPLQKCETSCKWVSFLERLHPLGVLPTVNPQPGGKSVLEVGRFLMAQVDRYDFLSHTEAKGYAWNSCPNPLDSVCMSIWWRAHRDRSQWWRQTFSLDRSHFSSCQFLWGFLFVWSETHLFWFQAPRQFLRTSSLCKFLPALFKELALISCHSKRLLTSSSQFPSVVPQSRFVYLERKLTDN